MDISVFHEIIQDKHFFDYKKMSYKYENFNEFLNMLFQYYCHDVPLKDENNNLIIYIDSMLDHSNKTFKELFSSQVTMNNQSVENEIISTNAIEKIDIDRDSIRNIMKGLSPKKKEEEIALGYKRGLLYISDVSHHISEENIYALYNLVITPFLENDDRLLMGNDYRHDAVYVVSSKIDHVGISHKKVYSCMKDLIEFINTEDNIDDLHKASIIHFYFSYVHPYFDGNGRMARLIHLWYLIQKGYSHALSVPFSQLILESKKQYYNAFTVVEDNQKISGKIDVTPFLLYMDQYVYQKMKFQHQNIVLDRFNTFLDDGIITEKEKNLWEYVVIHYGKSEFSTKQLEKDYNNAAYATIRSFVIKFESLGLLASRVYSNKKKYFIQ